VPEVGPLGPGPGAVPAATPPRPEALSLGLRLGEVVEAEFLEALGQREGLLAIGGRVFRALHPEGLAPGQRLALRLVSPGPPPVFRLPEAAEEGVVRLLWPPAQGLASAARVLLGGEVVHAGSGPLLAALQQVLRLPEEPGALGEALARLLRNSGLHHEASLARGEEPADLKALALRLLGREPAGPLAKAAEALLGHVEAHQARSALEGVLVVPLLLPWGEEWAQGELRVEDGEERGRAGAGGKTLRIRLEMPRLGPVEALVRWGQGGVAVRLGLAPDAVAEAREKLPELSARLSDEARVRVADLRVEALPPPAPRGGPGRVEVVA